MIFVGVSLIPTIILMIIPTYLQIQEEEKRRQSILEGLNTKAIQVFTNLAIEKRNQYEERLYDFISQTKMITSTIKSPTFLTDEEEIFLQRQFGALLEENPVIEAVSWCGREQQVELSRENRGILSCQQYCHTLEETSVAKWIILNQPDKSLLLYIEPIIKSENGRYATLIVGIDLTLFVSEVSRFGIAPESLLLLMDREGYILGIPLWAINSPVLGYLECESNSCINNDLARFAPQPFLNDILQWKGQSEGKEEVQIIQSSLQDYPIYVAFTRLGETPVYLSLFLTSNDLYNQAESYGASLQFNRLSIITRGLLYTGGFLVTIVVGALLTLQQLSNPLREVVEAAQRVEKGDFSTHVREVGLGELQTLAVTHNRMVQAIHIAQERLNLLLLQRQEEFLLINEIADQTNAEGNISDKLDQVISILGKDKQICRAALFLEQGQGLAKVVEKIFRSFSDCNVEDDELYQSQSAARFFRDTTPITMIRSSCEDRVNIIVPIQVKNRLVGIFILQQLEPENLSSRNTFLQALATQIGILIENAELSRQLRDRSIFEERNRFARELHDSVTQSVFSLSLVAQGIKTNLIKANPDPKLIEQVDFLIDQTRQIRTELRGLIIELRPIDLGEEGLKIAILNHAESLRRSTGLQVDTIITGDADIIPYPVQYNLNRVTQEALSNVARHAKATKVEINLDINSAMVKLTIKDDGKGFDMEKVCHSSSSQGMMSMRERVTLLGGNFSISTAIGKGTTIVAQIPLATLHGRS